MSIERGGVERLHFNANGASRTYVQGLEAHRRSSSFISTRSRISMIAALTKPGASEFGTSQLFQKRLSHRSQAERPRANQYRANLYMPEKGALSLLAILLAGLVAVVTALLLALLMNISERKQEAKSTYAKMVELGENDTDTAKWKTNFPRQYDGYTRTAITTRTRFGGHGGSEAMPQEKIERDPWLKRMFLGYAFSIDYRDRRGHAYMLTDQENTQRMTKPQTGSCLHCHASVMPLYRQLGDGDPLKGFKESYKFSYKDLSAKLHEMGHAHPVGCVDCHDPNTMQLRVTRPGFIEGIRALAASYAPVPHLPSVQEWRAGDRKVQYDPNLHGTRNEMRSNVCAQCHVEYYCGPAMPLVFPWGKGLKVENVEAFWDATVIPATGARFFDYKHAESGAEILKAQHPEYEMWSQGIHARSGVSCADCHMPYMREGASKVSDHWVRSPLLNVNRACQTCHHFSEEEIKARVDIIQSRNHQLLQNAAKALMDQLDAIAKVKGVVGEDALKATLELQRKAQWRLDFVAAENSMGFHAPQEAARILAEAADLARQGQVEAMKAGM